MMLKAKKPDEILIFRTFIVTFRILPIFRQKTQFQVRHVFMTSLLPNALADCTHFGMFE